MKTYYIIFIFSFCLLCNVTEAQTNRDTLPPAGDERIYQIKTIDRNVYIGKIIKRTDDEIIILGELKIEIKIPYKNIVSIIPISKSDKQSGAYWFSNPNSTRYLFAPSAFNLRQGEGYYQNTYILLNSVNYGLTDFLSIGGGFEFISTFIGKPIFWVMPKAGFKVANNFHMAGGVLYFNILNKNIDTDFKGLGITYATATYGNENNNVSMGLGYGFVNDKFSKKPIITGSGMCRLSRKIGLVSENWFVPDENNKFYNMFSYGIRFMGERITVDLAFLNNSDIAKGLHVGIPYVDFVVKFGK